MMVQMILQFVEFISWVKKLFLSIHRWQWFAIVGWGFERSNAFLIHSIGISAAEFGLSLLFSYGDVKIYPTRNAIYNKERLPSLFNIAPRGNEKDEQTNVTCCAIETYLSHSLCNRVFKTNVKMWSWLRKRIEFCTEFPCYTVLFEQLRALEKNRNE